MTILRVILWIIRFAAVISIVAVIFDLPTQVNGSFYCRFIKRFFDSFLSAGAIIVLSPLLLVLTVVGAVKMKGNPFFTQDRPGWNEKIFKLIKFRTMTNEKDADGKLLPDDERLIPYGKLLRSTSLDELPELVNILKGDMSIVGPRPLLVKYLPYYTVHERIRHSVRPGLTGYAQAHGRNKITWEEKFELDIWYVEHISFYTDVKVIVDTIKAVLSHDGVSLNALEDFDVYRSHAVNTNK